jgi:alpha-mannosidase
MPTDRPRRTVVHLVPHTHWDREWYEPFQSFRLRLVDLVDELLARMEADSRMRFTLDGQCATVDDYLEVRPEAEGLIRRLVAEGRLAIGPWQILMDEFLVSGETMVRNLEIGWRRATELGGAMRVGYLPDMFGHVAQMPQMLRRAGIDRAVVWRGVPAAIDRNTFHWSSPDGSTVEAEYLVGGYGQGAYLFDVPERFPAKLRDYVRTSASFYGEHSVLAMYGTDHAVPSPRLLELLDRANADLSDVVVRLETLAEYAVRAEGTETASELPRWTGELRSGARANLLMNVASARMDIKVAAGRAERLLERYAEPLTALHGAAWPERQLELAWRRVVDNSAHDSICGCSHDAVGAQVLTRFAEAEQLARGIVSRTLNAVAGRVPVGQWAAVNPSPAHREDLVELDVAVPPAWDAVEVQVDGRRLVTQEAGRTDPLVADLRLRGAQLLELLRRRRHGRELFQRQINGVEIESADEDHAGVVRILADDFADPAELDVEELVAKVESVVGERREDLWRFLVVAKDRRRVLARVPAPALSWSAIEVVEAGDRTPEGPGAVRAGPRSLDNGLVSVEIGEDGTFRLSGGGSTLEGVGRIVDGGDFGDSYNYGPPADDALVDEPVSVTVEPGASGPLRGEVTVRRAYRWPTGIEPAGTGRTAETVATEVEMRLELRAGEPFVRVHVAFENRSKDHRVRFHVPLTERASGSAAEGQFAVVERGLEAEGGYGEVALPAFPARGFVQTAGVTALLDHIVEYEVIDGRELAMTLLRSFGLISRNENPYREDPAGPQLAVPASQLPGPWSIGFGLLPHTGSWSDAEVVAAAEQYRHPFLTVRGTAPGTPAPDDASPSPGGERGDDGGAGIAVEGTGVVLTTLRRRGEWLEVRVVAESPEPVRATLRGPWDEAREADLLGRPGAPIPSEAGTLTLELGPWEIRTVQLRRVAAQPGAADPEASPGEALPD